MDLNNVYLKTLIPEFPAIYDANNKIFKRYLDVFYNETQGTIVSPVNTTGKIKGNTGEFVTTITDNLVVKKQWTNLYENTTTIDQDYYYAYIGLDASTRDASTMGTLENANYNYIDVIKPYYKVNNEYPLAFSCKTLGQEFQLIFDTSTDYSGTFSILINPSINSSYSNMSINFSDAANTWIKLIAVAYDPSWGTSWAVKQYGGTYSIALDNVPV